MTQYINKSALVAEINRLLDRYVSIYTFNYGATSDLNHLLSFIDTLPKEKVSEDLWDAKQIYYEELIKEKFDGGDVCNAFIASANWQKQRIIDNACEWLQKHMNDYIVHGRDIDFLYDDFRKAMEKEDEQ